MMLPRSSVEVQLGDMLICVASNLTLANRCGNQSRFGKVSPDIRFEEKRLGPNRNENVISLN